MPTAVRLIEAGHLELRFGAVPARMAASEGRTTCDYDGVRSVGTDRNRLDLVLTLARLDAVAR
jgi:hypothetical protein